MFVFSRFGARETRRAGFSRLPRVERSDLIRHMRALGPEGAAAARHDRYLVLPSRGPARTCIITDEISLQAAKRKGLLIVARARPRDFSAALQAILGPAMVREATLGMAMKWPGLSAIRRFRPLQALLWGLLGALLLLGAVLVPASLGMVITIVCGLFFLMRAALQLIAVRHAPAPMNAPLLKDAQLPVYTVLVPMFRERKVIGQLLQALRRLDYPAERLDIKLLLEADDDETGAALAEWVLPPNMEILVVPPGTPRTKPRALNYGLAFARGELVTIYDAEDVPHPAQLRVAASRFASLPDDVACLQVPLAWYNAHSSFFTRMIAIEYASHFNVVLPCLAGLGLPLPLGGTSNHFRIRALHAVGGWDPHNVTEDADLGLRLARFGWRTSVLPRVGTLEEACTTWRAWRHQRARWIKGWLQTFLVHQRAPTGLWRGGGARAFYTLYVLLGMGVFATLLHPFFIAWMAISLGRATLAETWMFHGGAHAALMIFALLVFITGYASALVCAIEGIRRTRQWHLLPWVPLLPAYWLLMSMAAWLALWDFIRMPHHWRKTEHGRELLFK